MCMGCVRHIPPDGKGITITLTGYQGAAQHTYTTACSGFHEPGPCPPSQPVVQVQRDEQEDTS